MLLFRHSEGDQQNGKSLGITHRFVCTKSQHKVFFHGIRFHCLNKARWSPYHFARHCRTQPLRSLLVTGWELGKQQLDRYVTVSLVPVCCSSQQKLDVYCLYCSQIFLLFKCRGSLATFLFRKSLTGRGSQEIFGKLKLKSLPFARRFDYRSKPNVDLVLWLRFCFFSWRPCNVLCWVGCGWMVKVYMIEFGYSYSRIKGMLLISMSY